MAYWCDDEGLRLEQQRLDAIQREALRRMEAERKQPSAPPEEGTHKQGDHA